MMKKKCVGRYIATLLACAVIGACLTACNKDNEQNAIKPQASESVASQDVTPQDERKEYEEYAADIAKKDVLVNAGKMEAVQDIANEYDKVPMEMLADAVAYQTAEANDGIPTYIFIAKLLPEADAARVSDELMAAALTMPGMDKDGAGIQVATTNGCIIMVGAANAQDIATKFSKVMSTDGASQKGTEEIYFMLSQGLT